jgi:hypothetical protein
VGGRSSGGLACEPLQEVIHQLAQIVEGLAGGEHGNEKEDPETRSFDVSHLADSTVFAGAMIAELASAAKRRPPGKMAWGPTSSGCLPSERTYHPPNPGWSGLRFWSPRATNWGNGCGDPSRS